MNFLIIELILYLNKKKKFYASIYNYKILIKESIDKYNKLIEDNGVEEMIKNPLESKTKNICDKYESDYRNLKITFGINVNVDANLMDIEDDNIFNFHEKAFFFMV